MRVTLQSAVSYRIALFAVMLPAIAALAAACQEITVPTAPGSIRYSVSGEVIGANGPLTVACNSTTTPVTANGTFACSLMFAPEDPYTVTVSHPPTGQQCTVADGNGLVQNANVATVVVTCSATSGDVNTLGPPPSPTPTPSVTPIVAPTPGPTPTPTPTPQTPLYANIQGSVPGSELNLSINGSPTLISGDGNTMLMQGPVGGSYTVVVLNDGAGMACQSSNLSGTLVAPATYVMFTCKRAMSFATDAAADVVVGQTGFTTAAASGTQTGLHTPKGVAGAADGTYLYIADGANARIAGVQAPIATDPTYAFTVANQTPLDTPRAVDTASGRTAIADAGSSQVFLYDTKVTSDRAPDVTLGGSPHSCNPYVMDSPSGVAFTATSLIVADTGNNRVLIFTPIPSALAAPQIILGQASGYVCSRHAVAGNTVYGPQDVWTDGNTLFVADTGNNRVLIWSTFPNTPNPSADMVLGQASLTAANAAAANPTTLNAPEGLVSDGTTIFVADTGNNRVLGYPFAGASAGRAANIFFGQTMPTGNLANLGGPAPSAQTLSAPSDIAFFGTALVVADTGNNRVLLYNSN